MHLKKLSIIVPYRNREEHLEIFAPVMYEYLKNSNIPFDILLVEQTQGKPFNRGKLLNIGTSYKKESDYYCFHDIDMIPMDADYSYAPNPIHLASKVEQFNYSLPYEGYFGGVLLYDKENFIKTNGYSNEFWGWGVEDDDLRDRTFFHNIAPQRRSCVYRSLFHTPNGDTMGGTPSKETLINRQRYYELKQNNPLYFKEEGLNSLKYDIVNTNKTEFYEIIKVEI